VSTAAAAGKGPALLASAAPASTSPAADSKRPDPRGPQSVPGATANGTATGTTAPVDAAPAAPDASPGARPDLVRAGQQWLDAYQRRDRDAMAASGTDNITVSDERSVTERFPAWQNNVRRDLDQVELELTGDTALLTARMTEHADGAQAGQHVSRVSQIWVRRGGRWRLADVRIIGEARLNQIVR